MDVESRQQLFMPHIAQQQYSSNQRMRVTSIVYTLNAKIRILVHVKWVLSPQHGVSSGADGEDGLQIRRIAANILNKHSQTANRKWPSSLWVGQWANPPPPG
jgi:hypothetical protein